MATTCENVLTLQGSAAAEVLQQLLAASPATGTDCGVTIPHLLGAVLPVPSELADQPSPPWPGPDESGHAFNLRLAGYMGRYGATNWADWSREAWGTAWDTDAVVAADGTNGQPVVLTFATVDTAPVKWLVKFSRQHPQVTATLNYRHADVEGTATYVAGRQIISDGTLVAAGR